MAKWVILLYRSFKFETNVWFRKNDSDFWVKESKKGGSVYKNKWKNVRTKFHDKVGYN